MIDTVVLQLECEEEQINSQFFSLQEHKHPNKHVAISTVLPVLAELPTTSDAAVSTRELLELYPWLHRSSAKTVRCVAALATATSKFLPCGNQLSATTKRAPVVLDVVVS